MPLITVWPLSWSTATRNDGSSVASRASAWPIFSWSPLVFGSTAISITGSGNSMRSSTTGCAGIGQRVAGRRVLEPGQCQDVAGARFLDVLAVVGVHQQHAADALAVVLDRVQHLRAGVQHARIDPDEGQGADKRVGHDLEGEAGERLVVRGAADDDLVRAHLDALDRRDIGRRRQIVDDGVEQRLNALVLEGRAAQHRHEGAG